MVEMSTQLSATASAIRWIEVVMRGLCRRSTMNARALPISPRQERGMEIPVSRMNLMSMLGASVELAPESDSVIFEVDMFIVSSQDVVSLTPLHPDWYIFSHIWKKKENVLLNIFQQRQNKP